ncbi:MAG: Lrp/AsnC family transcriptional regulator [Candidatus Fournierella pullistercoris]|uniref:Lrp/AsnC family transcriptional regulator n=1 Tax=Candidatus Allofournierella pullistercoris TaxID=2838597 RepID=A0A948WQF5_9FIRM|nr:Lrp/AsnC family transcriptional regulator [Candidatus Fournierella pullistercoris]
MEQLLKVLERNARLSLEDLAAMTGQSVQQVAKALDEYQQEGVIRGYHALIDWEKVCSDRVQAFIELRVRPKKSHGFDEIATAISQFPEVESVTLMSGGYDLQLVITGHSFQEIALFVAKRLSPMDDVLSTATHFVLRTYKKDGVIYGGEEKDEREWATL